MDYIQIFYYYLLQVLYPTCPYDTGNMVSHIVLDETPEYFIIKINAPTARGYDYAVAVNEALCAQAQGRTRSIKEERNYHWIQRAIKQAAQLTAGQFSGDINSGGITQ